MSDKLNRPSEWRPQLEMYGARYDGRDKEYDGILNEVWTARSGEAFLVAYVVGENDERLVTQSVIERRIVDLLTIDPADPPLPAVRVEVD